MTLWYTYVRVPYRSQLMIVCKTHLNRPLNGIESNQNQIPTSLDDLRKMRPSLSTMRMAVAGSVIKDEKASANGFLRNTTRSAKAPGATTPTSPSMLKSWAHVVVAERSTDAGLWTRHRSENSSSWCLCMPPNKSLPKQMFTPWFSANASASKPLPRRSLTCHIDWVDRVVVKVLFLHVPPASTG